MAPFDVFTCNNWGQYYMGADQLSASLLYFMLMYYGMYKPALLFAGLDMLYYGQMGLGGPIAGILGGLILL